MPSVQGRQCFKECQDSWRAAMSVEVPTPSQLRNVADEIGLTLTDGDVTSFIELIRPTIDAYNAVDAMPDNLPPVRYSRTPGYRPTGERSEEHTSELQSL